MLVICVLSHPPFFYSSPTSLREASCGICCRPQRSGRNCWLEGHGVSSRSWWHHLMSVWVLECLSLAPQTLSRPWNHNLWSELSTLFCLLSFLPSPELQIPTDPHKESDIRILCLLVCVNYMFSQLIETGTFFLLKCSETLASKGFYLLRLEIYKYRYGNIFRVHGYWIIILYIWKLYNVINQCYLNF